MTQAGLWQLQKAIVTVLSASAALQSLISNPVRVYDVPPPNATYPFILVGNISSQQWSARDFNGQQVTLAIDTFVSDYRGSGLVKQIMDVISAALDNGEAAINAALAAGTVVLCQFHGIGEQETADGVTWMGTAKFNLLLEIT